MISPWTAASICVVTLTLACNPPEEQPLTSDEQAVIAAEVEEVFDGIAVATNGLELDQLLGNYRQSDALTYVARGQINRSFETFQEMVDAQFGGLTESRLEWGTTYVDVLTRDVAVVTAIFEYTATLPSGDSVGSAGTFSCVFVLGERGWQVQHSSHTFPAATG